MKKIYAILFCLTKLMSISACAREKKERLRSLSYPLSRRLWEPRLYAACIEGGDLSSCKQYKKKFRDFRSEANRTTSRHACIVKQMKRDGRKLRKRYGNAPEFSRLLETETSKYISKLDSYSYFYSRSTYWEGLFTWNHLVRGCLKGERPTLIRSRIGLAPRTYCEVLIRDFDMKVRVKMFEKALDDWITFLREEARG